MSSSVTTNVFSMKSTSHLGHSGVPPSIETSILHHIPMAFPLFFQLSYSFFQFFPLFSYRFSIFPMVFLWFSYIFCPFPRGFPPPVSPQRRGRGSGRGPPGAARMGAAAGSPAGAAAQRAAGADGAPLWDGCWMVQVHQNYELC